MSPSEPILMTKIAKLALTFALALVFGCGPSRKLALDARRLTTAEVIEQSTLVVVGRIVGIRVLGEARQTGQGVRVKMWKVEVDPEYWLRGHLDGRFTYYLFNYSNDVVQNGDFEWLSRGDKRLFFLTYEGATIRAVADLYKTSIALPAGNSPNPSALGVQRVSGDHKCLPPVDNRSCQVSELPSNHVVYRQPGFHRICGLRLFVLLNLRVPGCTARRPVLLVSPFPQLGQKRVDSFVAESFPPSHRTAGDLER